MTKQFDELTGSLAQSVTRRSDHGNSASAFGRRIAGLLVLSAGLVSTLGHAAGPDTGLASVVWDPAGDAVFPYDLYDGPVPPYLDVIKVSITLNHGVFHFEIEVNGDI